MARLCARCAQLLLDFINFVRRVSSRIAEHIKECMAMLREGCCLWKKSDKLKPVYEPVIYSYEKQAAQEFFNHLDTGSNQFSLEKETLETLTVLAFSKNIELQHSAALYYLHMSQNLTTPLPTEFLEPFHPLLHSADLEVQKMSSLSLVNFLLEKNLNKELVVEVGLLEPILDLLESGDSVVQCNSCACIMTLSICESNREAIASAGGILPLLTLAKSYDPRVQQNAVGAILNLTRSERIRTILCRGGALPVLTLLLQSADSEIQYYSCASLSNIAANPEHHKVMLAIGDGFLLRTLVSLMSSSVQKVSSQACLCLNNLASSGEVRTHLLAIDVIPLIVCLLNSSNRDVRQASVTLLCTMSHPPGNLDVMQCEEMLQCLAMLMQTERANPVVVIHAACIMQNLTRTEGIKVIVQSQCFEELLVALQDPNNDEESQQYLVSCMAELTKYDHAREHLTRRRDQYFLKCLVKLSGSWKENKELAFQAATVLKQLAHAGRIAIHLKPFMKDVQDYLMSFLGHPELRFQQMGVATLGLLSEDLDFSKAIRESPLMEQLERVQQETEETQVLLRRAISQTGSLTLED